MVIIDISDMGSKSFDNLESVNIKSDFFPKEGDENNNDERLSIVIYKVLLNKEVDELNTDETLDNLISEDYFVENKEDDKDSEYNILSD